MFIGFELILPISMMLFYFGRSCNLSLAQKTKIHNIGYLFTVILCAVGTAFGFILDPHSLSSLDLFESTHSMIGSALCLITVLSVCIYAAMRRYGYGLQNWLDFVWCFGVWTVSNYLMLCGLSIDSVPLFYYGTMSWIGLVVAAFIALAIYSYLTSEDIKFTMVIARGEDIGPCDGTMYHDDDADLEEDIVRESKPRNTNRLRIPFKNAASNTVSSEMERGPEEICMI